MQPYYFAINNSFTFSLSKYSGSNLYSKLVKHVVSTTSPDVEYDSPEMIFEIQRLIKKQI